MQPNGNRPVILSFQPEHLIGWGITIALCLAPVFMWLQVHPLTSIHGFAAIMLAIGRVTGLVGMIMYALNLVFATRLRFLEPFFGGLNRVYIAHHLLGGFALIFLSLHPLFLALRYVQSSLQQAALLLLPNGLFPLSALFNRQSEIHAVVLEQWAIFFGIVAFWGMVALLLVTFFIKIPYRLWLFSHKFLGLAFFIGGLHVLFITSDTSQNAVLKYYTLFFTVLGLLAYVYRTLLSKIFVRHYSYRVESVMLDGGNVAQISLSPVKDIMPYKPGQFIFIHFGGNGQNGISGEWHPFSISSAPHEPLLRVSVKSLGDYTSRIAGLQPGTLAEIEGAYGRFTYTNHKNKNQIWVAGGIGVTPFISMAKSLGNDGYQIDLYYSVKTASELIDWKVLYDTAMAQGGHFRVIPYIGDQQPGHLTADFIEQMSGGLKGKDIYMCGPPPMMQSLRKQLKDKAVPGVMIHSEEFAMS